MNHKTIIIGDVHGCLDELRRLLDALAPTSADRLVFAGDLLDKGPDSPGVVRYLFDLSGHCQIILIEGNHEEKHRRWRKHRHNSPTVAAKMTGAAAIEQIERQLSPDDIAFLESALPYLKLPEYDTVVVHAGIPSRLDELPDDPAHIVTLSRRQRELYDKLKWLRFESPEGKIIMQGRETERDRYWALGYDGRFGRAFFGHQPFFNRAQPALFRHAVGLDLGAVHGGYLCAAILSGQHVRSYCVPARRHYD